MDTQGSPRPLPFRSRRCSPLAALWSFLAIAAASHAQDAILHDFSSSDGGIYSGLTLVGSTLYDDTHPATGGGDVFSINTDGTGYAILHQFSDFSTGGSTPIGSLTISGSTIYGNASSGGSSGFGLVYEMNTNGTGFTVLHNFAGGTTDGSTPDGPVVLSGSTIYGTTQAGGTSGTGGSGDGTVYKMNSDGSGFTVLHNFDTTAELPVDILVSGSKIYGTTTLSSANSGTVFSMNLDGTGYTTLHTFSFSDGAQPYQLKLVGTTLYGATNFSGSGNAGTIFSLNTNGTGFTTLHTFTNGTADGQDPGGFTIIGSKLYGTTDTGGTDNDGVFYSMNLNGTGYTIVQSFLGNPDGANSFATPALSGDGSTFYGGTIAGGTNNDGVIYSIPVSTPEPAGTALCAIGALALAGRRWKSQGSPR